MAKNTRNTRSTTSGKMSAKMEAWRQRELKRTATFIADQKRLNPLKIRYVAPQPVSMHLVEAAVGSGPDELDEVFLDRSVRDLPDGGGSPVFDEDAPFWAGFDDEPDAGLPEEPSWSPLFASSEVELPEAEELELLQRRERTVRSVLARLLERVSDEATLALVEGILDLGAVDDSRSLSAADDVRLWADELERSGALAPGRGFERLNRDLSALFKLLTPEDRALLAKVGIRFGRLSPQERAEHLSALGLPSSGVVRSDVRSAKVAVMAEVPEPKDQATVELAAAELLRQSDAYLFLDPEKQR